MIIKLKERDSRYPDLTAGQLYLVIGIEADDYRLLNDQGRPYLYPSELFEIADATEPGDWQSELGEDRERYAYPPPLNQPGFFEDYFDANLDAIRTFWRVVNQRLAATAA